MTKLSFLSILTLSLQLMNMMTHVLCQDAPLFIQGGLEGATADDDTYNTGGFIQLNGFNIQVPKNMLVQFPAAYVPWKDFVEDKTAMMGYEINVIGNFINNVPIAAQIIAYEFFEGLSSGFIESVNFSEGTLQIASGPTLRISDPNAVFSVGYTGAPFFTADDESPSISSFSGFPMCIPRNASDPLCPSTNRPFQGSGTFTVADPLRMAPFLAGDFVTFSGIRRGNEMICFSIVAQNVQITTLQDLVYVRMELGLLGIDNFNLNTELAESRFVGFVSNSAATVALYAMDYDPCTGAVTDRIVAAMGLKGGRNEQNKFEYRADITQGYARDYRVVAEINGIPKTRTTKNGLLAGTYVQPVNVWVHAEQLTPGTQPPAYDFSQMPWLTNGVGVDEFGNLWGPLDPFPQTGILIDPPVCGSVSALSFKGDEVKTDWAPSYTLMNQTLPDNSTSTTNTTISPATAEASPIAKRAPNVRWLSRARLDATTLPAGDPQLIQVSVPQPE
ncbi:hypothetical protein JX265_013504 [Neoarthrinium moseri]|uniref:Uncharacterized protein n=1 Tax=Neoarthrinium moseri TaxID=1658444 RepID=A0A9Q0AHN9_9PEZI|nr:uncharacterized protein JN550_005139 [Neoarthrinium moseri]KAI1841539.1 hypothetical protein JX266_012291 [Neoarthrinium moseri]KAI1849917.1 hypothetical protein JX265_013504 [Neoarthrinium moseri]KAI1870596.1 hypothetical protein JN550_005139 [Neoarthrinium moseri]